MYSTLPLMAILSLMTTRTGAFPFDFNIIPRQAGAYCAYPSTYTITGSEIVFGDPELVTGDFVGPGPAGESISSGYTYSRGASFTGGIQGTFEISDVFKIAPSASAGTVVTKGTTISATVNCPANITCGLAARPQLMRLTGTQTIHLCGSQESYDTSYPCTATAPTFCPAQVWNTTAEQPSPFIADFPVSISGSTVAGQDSIAVDFIACSVGSAQDGLYECPINEAVPPPT